MQQNKTLPSLKKRIAVARFRQDSLNTLRCDPGGPKKTQLLNRPVTTLELSFRPFNA